MFLLHPLLLINNNLQRDRSVDRVSKYNWELFSSLWCHVMWEQWRGNELWLHNGVINLFMININNSGGVFWMDQYKLRNSRKWLENSNQPIRLGFTVECSCVSAGNPLKLMWSKGNARSLNFVACACHFNYPKWAGWRQVVLNGNIRCWR